MIKKLLNRLQLLTGINKLVALAATLVVGIAGYMVFAIIAMDSGPKLYMQLGGGSETSHSSIEVEVRLDTSGHDVNAVQADLNYPADKLRFIEIDEYESAFEIEAEAEGDDGLVKIARGNLTGVSGDVLVAKVWFEVLETKGNKKKDKITLSFADTSMAVSATDNLDILSSTQSLQYDAGSTDSNKGKGHGSGKDRGPNR